jgi:hypothetical protein
MSADDFSGGGPRDGGASAAGARRN